MWKKSDFPEVQWNKNVHLLGNIPLIGKNMIESGIYSHRKYSNAHPVFKS